MNELILDILDKGFILEVKKDKDMSIVFIMKGFYKSGEITLREVNGDIYAISRYSQEDYIPDFESLVRLNHYWWLASKERHDSWKIPDIVWLPFYIEYGIVQITENTIYTYK